MRRVHWGPLNPGERNVIDSTDEEPKTHDHEPSDDPFAEQTERVHAAIMEILEKEGIDVAFLIFNFQKDEAAEFRTIKRGHFYDSLSLISAYSKKAKTRIMSDLHGLGQ